MNEYDVVITRILFDDGVGSKVRPALVISLDGEVITTLKITSQYENKSEYIKSRYFEIIDYVEAGLRKRSWVDTLNKYELNKEETQIRIIGSLTQRDQQGLIDFLSNIDL